MKINLIKYISIGFGLCALALITLSSIVYLYEIREKIYFKISSIIEGIKTNNYNVSAADRYWGKEILNGGYILHFRHAERDKWIDVQMYDALESDLHDNGKDQSRYAENDYFANAVCLNERGKIQAKAMGEHIRNIGLPISYVASSVSCRARQTASLAFDGYDSQHRLLVHSGPYNESYSDRANDLKHFYVTLPVDHDPKANVIVSAHNSVVRKEMFENAPSDLSLEEGGFYVISNRDGKLYLEHEFHNFRLFSRVFYER